MKLRQYLTAAKNRFYAKYVAPRMERTYEYEGEKIHYLFYPKDSDALMIIFQAYNAEGPRYNYLSTLSGIPASRLYISDDFIERTGDYYLGRNGYFQIERGVYRLIDDIIHNTKAKKLFFIGSSKGGYAAINFGISYPSVMIVAAPQYYLGTYMDDAKKFNPALKDILGEVTEEGTQMLDNRLKHKIENDQYAESQRLYLHCSVNESTWEKHAKHLLQDMENSGIQCEFNKGEYKEHGELRYYFPGYMVNTLERYLKE